MKAFKYRICGIQKKGDKIISLNKEFDTVKQAKDNINNAYSSLERSIKKACGNRL